MSDFGDDLDAAEALARRERDAGVARLQSAMTAKPGAECLDCGEPLSAERVKLVPWAVRCLECQRTRERRGRAVSFGELAREAVQRVKRGLDG